MDVEEEEWIGHTLQEAERRQCISKVLSMERKDAVEKGNNFVSDIYRLKLRVLTKSGEVEERSVIYKVLPVSDGKMTGVKEMGIFRFEIRTYQETMSTMARLLKSKDPTGELIWPEFYGVKGNYEGFLMEDVSVLGYMMGDRRKGLDLDHCEVALKCLAKFHALAATGLEIGSIHRNDFPETHFLLNNADRLKRMHGKIQENLVKAIKDFWPIEWQEFIEGLQKYPDLLVPKLVEISLTNQEVFQTINHGDFWLNNILFKYDSSGTPKSTRFVDYQFCHYSSPCFDIHYFFATSLRLENFDKKEDLLCVYHESLAKNLKLFGYGKPCPSLEDLKMEFERQLYLEFHFGLLLRPGIMNPPLDELVEKYGAFDDRWMLSLRYDGEEFLRPLRNTLTRMRAHGLV